jgi:magnesium-transporting ATPase (P-type)
MSLLAGIIPVASAQSDLSSSTSLSRWSWLFGGIGILLLILIVAVVIVYYILYFMSIYNWGTTDSTSFPGGLHSKKVWFWLFFLVPLIVAVVFGWIPFVNIVFMLGLGIYMLVIVLYYFFGIRPKTKMVQNISSEPVEPSK